MSYSVPPPMSRLVRMSPRRTVIENDELKNFRLTNPAATRQLDRVEIDRLEVQPIRDHQLDVVRPARGDHLPAFLDRDRHRLFAQHVDAGPGGANRVLGVHRIGQRDVDGIDAAQALVEFVVVERVIEPIPLRDLAPLGSIAADDCSEREFRRA